MVGQTKPASKIDRERFDKLQQIGCIVSLLYFGYVGTPGDIHHLLNDSGHRFPDQHHYTICLAPWFHRGVPPTHVSGHQMTVAEATVHFGPSMALDKAGFERKFGPDVLLWNVTNHLLSVPQKRFGDLLQALENGWLQKLYPLRPVSALN